MSTYSPDTFEVDVEDIGKFVFRKRNMRAQIEIEAEYSRLTEGVQVITAFLGDISSKTADLKVLTLKAPDGWDVDELDAWDDDSFEKLAKVWSALRDKEASFRAKPGGPEGDGEGERKVD